MNWQHELQHEREQQQLQHDGIQKQFQYADGMIHMRSTTKPTSTTTSITITN